MKKLILTISLCLTALFFTSDLLAQNYWKGGTPGKETDWNTAKNWSQNRIPDWSQDVVIPDVSTQSGYFPVISSAVDIIPHIKIHGNALLTVLSNGRLTIDGETTYNCGIYLVGKLISNGEVAIFNTGMMEIDRQGGELRLKNEQMASN